MGCPNEGHCGEVSDKDCANCQISGNYEKGLVLSGIRPDTTGMNPDQVFSALVDSYYDLSADADVDPNGVDRHLERVRGRVEGRLYGAGSLRQGFDAAAYKKLSRLREDGFSTPRNPDGDPAAY